MSPRPASSSVLDFVSQTLLNSIESENPATATLELSSDQHVTGEILNDVVQIEAAINETVELLKQRLTERISDVRRRHNAQLSIYRLPPEMLSKVIFYGMDEVERHNHLHRLIQLSSVARWWRAVVLGIPSLWSVIAGTDRREILELALERSQDSPLAISFNDNPPSTPLGLQSRYLYCLAEDVFVGLVCPHIGRWREATFQWIRLSASIDSMCGQEIKPSPYLERLHILRPEFPTITEPTYRLPGRLERLLDLKLQNLVVSTEEIIRVLAANPQFVSLDLESLIEAPEADQESVDPPPDTHAGAISLPHLVTLRLTWLPSKIMMPILEQIRAPNLTTITIRHDTNVQSNVIEDPYEPNTGPFAKLVARILEATPSVYLWLKSSGIILKDFSETATHYEVELKGGHYILLRWFRLRCLPQLMKGYHLHLDFDSDFTQDNSDDVVVENLMRLPKVKSLRLRSHPEAWRWVWLLSLPDAMPGGSANSWLWHELTEVTLRGDTINEVATLSMLLGRFGLPSAEPIADGPLRLRMLKIESGGNGWRPEVVERIKDIVGEERFVLES
ncbi:hypothetical protein M407DRAFT_27984 [Tulasnella calospora MUT 4182]|uniref:F-box domain-containing protein n=1 Tax=Tulasnella calospora MUT 4182 TaxID=1051891 RepID=A0A0C3KMA3_9AGAM|nr:hypothetical protein M407DRAFT_27984 [Tulasnella calospora MUT 4182]